MRPEALCKNKVRRLSSLPLRRLPTRCCEVAGRCARAPRVGFDPASPLARLPVRCICCAGMPGFCVQPGLLRASRHHVRARVLSFASSFWLVPLPQVRSSVPVHCLCCDGMPGFCTCRDDGDGRAVCVLGAAVCVCVLREWACCTPASLRLRACACASALHPLTVCVPLSLVIHACNFSICRFYCQRILHARLSSFEPRVS